MLGKLKFLLFFSLLVFISTATLFSKDYNTPKRVIAGTVAISEILSKLSVNVIAVPTTNYELPKEFENLPRIGNPMKPDLEVLKSLKPDLFVSDASLESSLKNYLDDNKIPYKFVKLNSIDDLKFTISELGKLLGKSSEAQKLLAELNLKEARILASIKEQRKPKVMIIFGTPGNFMLATDKSFVGSLVKKLGGINVVKSESAYVPINLETLLISQPDVILRFSHADPRIVWELFEKEFSENKIWNSFEAVKNGKVHNLEPEYFGVSAKLNAIDALEKLSKILFK
ncbi:MAG: heme ABC transporter substrate-binding protein IsdE [Fervidobacterium sp.]|nr:heme ABC transporter substrate-binding protein IsdE [Fervidobacterium sp.]